MVRSILPVAFAPSPPLHYRQSTFLLHSISSTRPKAVSARTIRPCTIRCSSITPPSPSSSPSILRITRSLWPFSRPHTMWGTACAIISITTLAALHTPCAMTPLLNSFFTALIPSLLMNIYVVGLNQMSDIPIDRINKPFLPLASGAMTLSDARLTVTIALILSLAFCLAPAATPALRAVLIGSAALGTLYSAPPFRLKRFALLASISILTVRGLLVNLGFFLHASSTPLPLPAPVTFATIFFTLFGIVIALLKDVPDISGDAQFGIRTFSVTLGAPIIFRTCQALLSIMFVIAAAFYYSVSRSLLGGILVAVTHLLVAAYLAYRGNKVDPKERSQVKDFYMFSWKTFYLEYLLLPLAMI